MATNILTPTQTQYSLPNADRQVLLAGMPRKIQYPDGIVPDLVLQQTYKYFPELEKHSQISESKMNQIMVAEIQQQRSIFIEMYGNDGVFKTALNNKYIL